MIIMNKYNIHFIIEIYRIENELGGPRTIKPYLKWHFQHSPAIVLSFIMESGRGGPPVFNFFFFSNCLLHALSFKLLPP